jgi:hypothetical protein
MLKEVRNCSRIKNNSSSHIFFVAGDAGISSINASEVKFVTNCDENH